MVLKSLKELFGEVFMGGFSTPHFFFKFHINRSHFIDKFFIHLYIIITVNIILFNIPECVFCYALKVYQATN